MRVDYDSVRRLERTKVNEGEQWIYSADFNSCEPINGGINPNTTDRLDTELSDWEQLIYSGARVAILAHKGRYKDGDTADLDFTVPYLSKALRTQVHYYPENATRDALEFFEKLKPGELAVMGNVRKNEGEEKNDPALAAAYAQLGSHIAVGGFGKAHRLNASNGSILDHRPGYLTDSQVREMSLLAPWSGKDDAFSVAVIGGIKKEKITVGLAGLAETYDAIIPGGIVLNTLLRVMGYDIGSSVIEDGGKTFEKETKAVLEKHREKICIPREVYVARPLPDGDFENVQLVDITRNPVPQDCMIVDFYISDEAFEALENAHTQRGRLLVAGTPGLHKKGFSNATASIINTIEYGNARSLVLGGDTANELSLGSGDVTVSTGGGSALEFLRDGTTAVFEALKRNKLKFPD